MRRHITTIRNVRLQMSLLVHVAKATKLMSLIQSWLGSQKELSSGCLKRQRTQPWSQTCPSPSSFQLYKHNS